MVKEAGNFQDKLHTISDGFAQTRHKGNTKKSDLYYGTQCDQKMTHSDQQSSFTLAKHKLKGSSFSDDSRSGDHTNRPQNYRY